MMKYVLCTTENGLRDKETHVIVRDIDNRQHGLRVESDYLFEDEGQKYLPVGIIGQPRDQEWVLIELPHEADSGFGRLRVPQESIPQKVLT